MTPRRRTSGSSSSSRTTRPLGGGRGDGMRVDPDNLDAMTTRLDTTGDKVDNARAGTTGYRDREQTTKVNLAKAYDDTTTPAEGQVFMRALLQPFRTTYYTLRDESQ